MSQNSPSPQEGLLSFGVNRPVGTLMVVLAAVIFGLVSLARLPLDLLPAVDYPSLTVRTAYPGAAPEDVEERVTEKLEDTLSTVGNLVHLRSSSRAEVSEILLEFEWGSNLPFLVQDVRERIDRVFLGQGVEKPLILRYDPSLDPVMRLAISGGHDLVRIRDLAEHEVERSLEGIEGVAAVRVHGGLEDEIQVRVDPQKLAAYQISAELIRDRLRAENLNVPGGSLEEGSTEYVVRTLNEFRSLEQMEDLPILTRGEAIIKLRDLATVHRTHKDRDVILRVDGQEAVEIAVFREAGANLVDVAKQINKKLFPQPTKYSDKKSNQFSLPKTKSISEKLPPDVRITTLSDQSIFVSNAIGEVRQAALIGGILAILVCFLFLRNLAVTIVIGLSVPISVIASFGAMYLTGVTLNVMSLGGLALGIGMLVDNAIVVLESITRCREEGDQRMQAAIRGVREVGSAVTASTLTTIAVFAPIVFVEGLAGQTFGDQALTVVSSLLLSLAVALFFIPGLAARLPEKQTATKPKPTILFPRIRQGRRFFKLFRTAKKPWVWPLTFATLGIGVWCFMQQGALLAPFADTVKAMKSSGWNPVPEEIQIASARWGFGGTLFMMPTLWMIGEPWLRMGIGLLADCLEAGTRLLKLAWIPLGFVGGVIVWIPGQLVSAMQKYLFTAYPKFLKSALRSPGLVLLVVVIAAGFTFRTAGSLGKELLPEVLQSELTADLIFPAGSPLEETDALAKRLEQKIRRIEGVKETATFSGADRESISIREEGPHTSRLLIRTDTGPGARETEKNVEAQIRLILDKDPYLARYRIRRPTLLAMNTPLEVEVLGDDLEELRLYANSLEARLRNLPGIVDVRSSVRRGNPEVRVELDREQLSRHNLTVAEVANRLRLAVEGDISSTFPGKDERIDIRVRGDLSRIHRVEQLRELPINPSSDKPLPLGAVATLTIQDGPSDIRRVGGRRAAVLGASLAGFDLGKTAATVEAALHAEPIPQGMEVRVGGQKTEMDKALSDLGFALLLAIFLVYAVMAAQFESLIQPLLILFSIPLAGVGAVLALAWTQTPLSVVALLGAVVLAGIVVNNAIVLVDRMNKNQQRGMALEEAILEAGKARIRPILMTTATTVLGMLPLMGFMGVGNAEGAELRAPMALVVIAGLLTSTLLTLVVIPTGYSLLHKGKRIHAN